MLWQAVSGPVNVRSDTSIDYLLLDSKMFECSFFVSFSKVGLTYWILWQSSIHT